MTDTERIAAIEEVLKDISARLAGSDRSHAAEAIASALDDFQ
jgi:hypothetical protein